MLVNDSTQQLTLNTGQVPDVSSCAPGTFVQRKTDDSGWDCATPVLGAVDATQVPVTVPDECQPGGLVQKVGQATWTCVKTLPTTSIISPDNTTAESRFMNLESQVAALTSRVTALEANLMAETARAESAESQLTTNLMSETSRAKSVESQLSTGLMNEISRAEGVESSLSSVTSNLDTSYVQTLGYRVALVFKPGNNGTSSCDTFCNGEQWGGWSGSCVSATYAAGSSPGTALPCSQSPGGISVSCLCLRNE